MGFNRLLFNYDQCGHEIIFISYIKLISIIRRAIEIC